MMPTDEKHAMSLLAERLHDRFPGTRQTVIDQLVGTALHQYDSSRVRAFIPVLVEREVSDRLRSALAA